MARVQNARMIGPLERALFLKSLAPFGDSLSPMHTAVLAENAQERTFRSGEAIHTPGRAVECFHTVVSGSVLVSGGEYFEGSRVEERGTVGFLSMIARRDAGLSSVALEDTVTLSFDEDVFLDILEDNFAILVRLIRSLTRQTLAHRQQIPEGTYLAPLDGQEGLPRDPTDFVERLRLLRRPGGVFGNSSMEAMARISAATPPVRIEAGKTLWKVGDRADHALIIASGTVACTTQWGLSHFRAGPGYPLGNLERFSGDPRWFTAVTETPLVALYTSTERLLDIMEDHTDLAIHLLRATAERLIRIQEENLETEQAARESEGAA
ncbi:MAG: hypothetical protein DHS20C21_23690 [Gemmatimonadota bacterium]|nr:MAG: hypothetical protein DHS20C21_23690 [Gemmatimonadota bacterium]